MEDKLKQYKDELVQWELRKQQILEALRECEHQITAHIAVIGVLEELLSHNE